MNDTDRLPRTTDPALRLALELDDGRRCSLPHCRSLTIGSDPGCDLVLADRFVSSAHAQVRFDGQGGYRIEDLRSTNGLRVDGVPVQGAQLEPGMHLELGQARLAVVRIDKSEEEARARRLRGDASFCRSPHRLMGRSAVMSGLRDQLEKLAGLGLPVLIRGETGTGKELAARTLHEFGPRPEAPFVALNCGAIPPALFESELFGHRRGAFTGAHRDHAGAFARAGRGTVFLDEVAELPLEAQAKLLRVLETRLVSPVGGDREFAIECRVLAATHRDLGAMVTSGQFREDLFHRLGVVEIELPALRRRRSDIPGLLEHFANQAAAELEREVVMSKAAVSAATQHPWPGNVRALRNAVMRAAALSEGPITAAGLLPAARPQARPDTIAVPRGTYADMNAALLRHVVAEEGSIRKAAQVLDVPRSTLGAWMQRM